MVGMRTAANYQSKINNEQQETTEINIHMCAWLLATRWIKQRSDRSVGSKNMNILLLGGGPAAGVLIVVMFCVRRIKKKENSRSEIAANSIRTLKNMYKGNNIFWEKC